MLRRFCKPIIIVFIVFTISIGSAIAGEPPDGDLKRIELKANPDSEIFKLVPCGKDGFIIFYATTLVDDDDKSSRKWVFTYIDSEMEQKWRKELPVKKDHQYRGYHGNDKGVFFVYYDIDKTKNEETNLQLFHFNFQTHEFATLYGKVPDRAFLKQLSVYRNYAVLGMDLRKDNVQVDVIDLRNGKSITLPINLAGQSVLEEVVIDSLTEQIDILVRNYVNKSNNHLNYFSFDFQGNQKSNIQFTSDLQEFFPNNAKLLRINEQEKIILGSYNNAAGKISDIRDETEETSAGFYVAKIRNEQQQFVKVYNFLDFENFYSTMRGNQILRIRRMAEKKDANSKDYSLNYRLLLHDIIDRDSSFVLVAEAFTAEYHTVTDMIYDQYGRPIPQTYTVFDGYKYFNAIIAGFDSEGNLLWDNGMDIWNVQSYVLDYYITSFFDHSDLVLVYNSEGKLASKLFEDGQVVGELEYHDVETKYNKDKILEDNNSMIKHWYGNYFLAYGYQKIRNNALRELNRRNVFYVNKIVFE